MKKNPAGYMIIGKIGSTYGVHGWLKIHTYTEHVKDILDFRPWYLSDKPEEDNTTWTAINILEGRVHGRSLIAKLEGLNSPEEAKLLTGKTIAIARSQLPKLNKDEHYWSDLIGMMVVNKEGHPLGKVIYLLETGSNDVLVIKNEKEHAIPYLMGDVIINVDLEKQEIIVDWELI